MLGIRIDISSHVCDLLSDCIRVTRTLTYVLNFIYAIGNADSRPELQPEEAT